MANHNSLRSTPVLSEQESTPNQPLLFSYVHPHLHVIPSRVCICPTFKRSRALLRLSHHSFFQRNGGGTSSQNNFLPEHTHFFCSGSLKEKKVSISSSTTRLHLHFLPYSQLVEIPAGKCHLPLRHGILGGFLGKRRDNYEGRRLPKAKYV